MNEISVVKNPKNKNEISFEEREKQLKEEKEQEEREIEKSRKSPFTRFYQVNKDKSEYLDFALRKNPRALQLLLFIFDHIDKYNAVICSYQIFTERLDMSLSTAKRAINFLKEHGYIYIYKSGSSNVYVVNPNLVWNSWGNNIKYCEFPTNIILSSTEQEKQIQKQIFEKQFKTIQKK